jgi:putative ATPase
MKDLGYGDGYRYPHDYPDAHVAQGYLPEKLRGQTFYRPSDRGHEKRRAEFHQQRKKPKP